MTCGLAGSLLSAYVDRELSGQEALALRDHLRTCTRCAAEYEELRAAKSLLASLGEVQVPEGLESRLSLAVMVPAKQGFVNHPFTLVAAAALFGVLAAVAASSSFTSEQPSALKPAPNARPASHDVYLAGADPLGGYAPVMPASSSADR